ncbi:MAG: hypothetical protein CFH19_00806 [Alphaproteobacteria bacterium MarineAlpha5_Bin9]|nr:MAG: hypothetical protein CFH19_00806 [Alphaproteobacteria bacterium MarineAlpha5_Bin9]|tara:strand:+ start:5001 stop:5384 length:384 start_codon:yes stop_codon:yes gene_type:complete
MIINTPISLGELVDKISILMIKKEKIKELEKLKFISKELQMLNDVLKEYFKHNELDNYINELVKINTKLWEVEDEIRDCERKKIFDNKFIELARLVYFSNDQRSKIKLEINQKFGSAIVEVKSYEDY